LIRAGKPKIKLIKPKERRKMLNENLTRRDAYFVGYAEAYQERIKQMKRENARWQEIVDKWPDGGAIPELKARIDKNNNEIKNLSSRVSRIMANVRR
jgi:predicted nuclease with TOPRIM domain